MAIPPSPGKFTVDELEKGLAEAKALVQAAENKLADAKKDGLAEPTPTAGRGGKFPEPAAPAAPATPAAKAEVKPSTIGAAKK